MTMNHKNNNAKTKLCYNDKKKLTLQRRVNKYCYIVNNTIANNINNIVIVILFKNIVNIVNNIANKINNIASFTNIVNNYKKYCKQYQKCLLTL